MQIQDINAFLPAPIFWPLKGFYLKIEYLYTGEVIYISIFKKNISTLFQLQVY